MLRGNGAGPEARITVASFARTYPARVQNRFCFQRMSVTASKTAARKVPEKIGKYAVINEVGRGSTGIVYLSHDAYYGRDVAIKVYNIETGGDEERARISRKMFLSEAHLVGML